jgi:hypothetical protein
LCVRDSSKGNCPDKGLRNRKRAFRRPLFYVQTNSIRSRSSRPCPPSSPPVGSLVNIALARSDHDAARKAYEEALMLYRNVGDVCGGGQLHPEIKGLKEPKPGERACHPQLQDTMSDNSIGRKPLDTWGAFGVFLALKAPRRSETAPIARDWLLFTTERLDRNRSQTPGRPRPGSRPRSAVGGILQRCDRTSGKRWFPWSACRSDQCSATRWLRPKP